MKLEYRIPLYVILGGGIVVFAVSFVPPLTSGGNGQSTDTASEARLRATLIEERAYCQEHTEDVNCRCFAQASVAILAHDTTPIPGAVYADKHDLARGQATRGC